MTEMISFSAARIDAGEAGASGAGSQLSGRSSLFTAVASKDERELLDEGYVRFLKGS